MLFSRRHPVRDDELNAYVDGELASDVRARVEAHVENCATCGETVAALRSLRGALSALPAARRQRSFVVREADVQAAAPRRATGLVAAMPLLSGVMVASLAVFAVLVGVDAGAGGSNGSRSVSTLEQYNPDAQELAAADRNSTDDAPGAVATVPLPATGPLPNGVTDGEEPPAEATDGGGFSAESAAQDTAVEKSAATVDEPGDSDTGLRAAEAGTAAVALAAGGSLAFVWWRRRTMP